MCTHGHDAKRQVSRRQIITGGLALTAGGVIASAASAQTSTSTQTAPFRRTALPAAQNSLTDQKLVQTIPIPKQSGRAVLLERGQRVKVVNPRGKQVGDLFAFARHSPDEFIAPAYTMTRNRDLYLRAGMGMMTNYDNWLLVLEEDTYGHNDLMYPACSGRQKPGQVSTEPNCRDNMQAALRAMNFPVPAHPELVHPHNLFQNSPLMNKDGEIRVQESAAKPGDFVVIRALENVVLVVTACASTRVVNAFEPKDLLMEVYA